MADPVSLRVGLLALLVAIALIAPAHAGTAGRMAGTGRVSPAEFRAVWVGERKHPVQVAWQSVGRLERQWKADGTTWRLKRYRTTYGFGTWLWATYQLRADNTWRLQDLSWCVVRDIARTYSTSTYDCFDHPWP